jgi:hypothetical protein
MHGPTRSKLGYAASLPERGVRALAAVTGGALYEAFQLALPRFVHGSRLYEVTARNLLRVAIEWVGGVQGAPCAEPGEPAAGEIAARKVAGNVVELGSIVAFGFSPLWLLAGAADVMHGSRVYLDALLDELKRAGVLARAAHADSVDELLAALERTSGRAAGLVDIPPLELAELRRSLSELRADAGSLPTPAELGSLLDGLRREAEAEQASLLEVSSGIGLAFLLSARNLGRTHLAVPYRVAWAPVRGEGFAAYARRVSRPYAAAVAGHFDPATGSWTERVLARLDRRPASGRP